MVWLYYIFFSVHLSSSRRYWSGCKLEMPQYCQLGWLQQLCISRFADNEVDRRTMSALSTEVCPQYGLNDLELHMAWKFKFVIPKVCRWFCWKQTKPQWSVCSPGQHGISTPLRKQRKHLCTVYIRETSAVVSVEKDFEWFHSMVSITEKEISYSLPLSWDRRNMHNGQARILPFVVY